MKVLLIGFGSIGRRHYEVLKTFNQIESIDIVTKQNLLNVKTFECLGDVNGLYEYDYFIIASETNKHYDQLVYLERNIENKIIFCEKPLFNTLKAFISHKNKIFIGYVLRFHPLFLKLKELLKNEKILFINAKCGQYLPTWRPNTDYSQCYSAKKEEGGGVLLDLSHEIDYVLWLAGTIIDLNSYQVKISDLKIDSDDLTLIIGKSTNEVFINITIDYISKITNRKLIVETVENTFELDFIQNELKCKSKNGLETKFFSEALERNKMFEAMHSDILSKNEIVCTLQEGLSVMNTIKMIQDENNE